MNTMENPIVVKGENLELTAALPAEMAQCQTALIEWCAQKIRGMREEINDLAAAVDSAVKHKWGASALKGQLDKAKKRIVYYGKVMSALKAGYCLIPNFPITGFAIRTKRKIPAGQASDTWWAQFEQKPTPLPEGEGEYKNPFPLVMRDENTETLPDGKTRTKKIAYPVEWDGLEFPLSMAKPQIIEAASEAMKLHVFDALGICPPARRRDPMIIGAIYDPTAGRFSERRVSFLIAWHLDTKVL